MTDYKLVLSSAPTEEEAKKIARALVEKKLAACVNIVPQVRSVYRWKDKVEESSEFLMLIKTFGTAIDGVRKVIEENHSYEVPELLLLPIESGSLACLKWIDNAVK